MMEYWYYVVAIDCMVLLCMSFMVIENKLLNKRQRIGLVITFIMIAILSIVELLTAIVDKKEGLRYLNIALNYIGFTFSPYVPVIYGNALANSKKGESRLAYLILIIYDIILAIGLPFGWIFNVDSANAYHRGILFPFFLVIYIASKLYLIYTSTIVVRKFQHRNRITMILLLIFFLMGSTIQIFKPDIHTSWSCITLIVIIYYTYFNDLFQQLDRMTGLFSHQSYIARASNLKEGEVIIIMDCDNFKAVNDNYGHSVGDDCLLAVSRSIKAAYEKNGICYRIGGDEFAVILLKGAMVDELNQKFIDCIRAERKLNPILPYVSMGTASFFDGANPSLVKNMADRIMYKDKQERKNRHKV